LDGSKLQWCLLGLGIPFLPKEKLKIILELLTGMCKALMDLSKNALAKKLVRNEVASSILKTYPDVICLQEFNNAEAENNISLFKSTHRYYFFSKDHKRNDGTYQSGCIIFSKYPIIDSGRVAFPSEESLIYADLLKGNDTIRIFTTHLQSFKFKKKDYADIEKIKDSDESSFSASLSIMRKMKAAYKKRGIQANLVRTALDRSPYPTVITGDFNDVPNSYTYFNIKADKNDAFLQRSFGLGRTFISIAPTLRIDYILLDKQFEVKQFDMVDEALSDHIMLVADIRLKK
jgi:endonuclease/exonuclease/phosphatase family metal-dependent hydrolase